MNRVEFFEERWVCGDGCCSDYWVEAEINRNGEECNYRLMNLSWINEENQEGAKAEILDRFDFEGEIEWVF